MHYPNYKERLRAFGFDVAEIDGHNISEICKALKSSHTEKRPKAVVANTIKGKGVSFMENVPIWHYRMPNEEELPVLFEDLGFTKEEQEGLLLMK